MTTTAFEASVEHATHENRAYRLAWIGSFPLCAAVMFAIQPTMNAAIAMAAVASTLMMVFASSACDPVHAPVRRNNVAVLSPVLAAVMVWLAISFGNALGAGSLAASAILSILALVGLYLADILISAAILLAASRGRAAAGVPVAVLFEGKFAGLGGRLF